MTVYLAGGYAVFNFPVTTRLYAVDSPPTSLSLIPGTYPIRAVTIGVAGQLAHANTGATLTVEAHP